MSMASTALALPLVSMFTLTMAVWLVMFIKRVSYIKENNVDAEEMKTPADTLRLISPEASAASYNLQNLFELPVIFYAVCLYLTVALQVDDIHVYCAWTFVTFRVLHSIIACSYNTVMHRFAAYLVASLALWVMVVRALFMAL